MGWMDRDEDEPETRSLSARMWSTSDRRTRPGSLSTTNSLRMWSTSTRTRRPDPIDALRERVRRLRQDDGRGGGEDRNPRTNRWTPPWKPAPGPGTVKEARQRAQENRRAHRFRPGTTRITDRVARRRGGFQSTGGTARGGFKRLTAIQNGRKGGRPRKLTTATPVPAQLLATDQAAARRGRFTSETARQAGARGGSRASTAKKLSARLNARRPRKRTTAPPLG